jgi:hypothetical protein
MSARYPGNVISTRRGQPWKVTIVSNPVESIQIRSDGHLLPSLCHLALRVR